MNAPFLIHVRRDQSDSEKKTSTQRPSITSVTGWSVCSTHAFHSDILPPSHLFHNGLNPSLDVTSKTTLSLKSYGVFLKGDAIHRVHVLFDCKILEHEKKVLRDHKNVMIYDAMGIVSRDKDEIKVINQRRHLR